MTRPILVNTSCVVIVLALAVCLMIAIFSRAALAARQHNVDNEELFASFDPAGTNYPVVTEYTLPPMHKLREARTSTRRASVTSRLGVLHFSEVDRFTPEAIGVYQAATVIRGEGLGGSKDGAARFAWVRLPSHGFAVERIVVDDASEFRLCMVSVTGERNRVTLRYAVFEVGIRLQSVTRECTW